MTQPQFPEGTPEYEAYRTELTAELAKFAKGDHPYEYDRTVINYGTGCHCDWLGVGTPEHTPSSLCMALRPDGPRESPLPDPTITGPCQAQAHWTCTGQAVGECLNPLAMLPDSTVSSDYVPMCLPCKDHLSDEYVTQLHRGQVV